ncbi:MAG: hypothetical protein A3D74_04335 [Candidatus Levybacteria bacterium RIFCSPHIGHO2_02_FULL_37_13]|nr:MAG: hypothetical protein A3D74_04335 [Candidatus Levybacteria bacterium RIFCSPHIGHO2_02_FULL_37_13]
MVEQGLAGKYAEAVKELQPWEKKTQDVIRKHNLLGRLNITSKKDASLFESYLVTRLIKTEIYDNTKFLNPNSLVTIEAGFSRTRQEEIVRINQNAMDYQYLFYLEEFNRMFVVKSYLTTEERNRARTIEHAVNGLCSHAIVFDERKSRSEFKPTKKLLETWTQTWKDRVKRSS